MFYFGKQVGVREKKKEGHARRLLQGVQEVVFPAEIVARFTSLKAQGMAPNWERRWTRDHKVKSNRCSRSQWNWESSYCKIHVINVFQLAAAEVRPLLPPLAPLFKKS